MARQLLVTLHDHDLHPTFTEHNQHTIIDQNGTLWKYASTGDLAVSQFYKNLYLSRTFFIVIQDSNVATVKKSVWMMHHD